MDKQAFEKIEAYMLSCTCDAAHDAEHVYRVLYNALDIAATEQGVDYDVLLAACLLHDIGRARQYENPKLCHGIEGGEMAFEYLSGIGFTERAATHAKQCIASHRHRSDASPMTMEAKILFDADKLDVSGATGITRSLLHSGQIGQPLYILDDDGEIVLDGGGAEMSSFFQEYHFKLKKTGEAFHTDRAREISRERQQAMTDFYDSLYSELTQNLKQGRANIAKLLGD